MWRGENLERNYIGHRPNRFHHLLDDGDWHTRLATALRLAKCATSSQELVSSIEVLEHQLAENDECIHTVTMSQAVPVGMDASYLMKCIEQVIDVRPASLCFASTGHVELTITARGDLNSVQCMAKSILSYGVAKAQGIMSADKFKFDKAKWKFE